MRLLSLLLAGILCTVLIAACTGDDDSTPTPEASPANGAGDATPTTAATQTPTPGATDEPAATPGEVALPDTPIAATLDSTYKTGSVGAPPAPDELPVPVLSVEARWYQSGGRYVVYYDGFSLAQSSPLCPGNSIKTEAGFENISNAPTAEGACTGATTLSDDPAVGVKLCGDQVLYVTEIPADSVGTLNGTIEVYLDDGMIIGVTSRSETSAGAAPEIDLGSCRDAVS